MRTHRTLGLLLVLTAGLARPVTAHADPPGALRAPWSDPAPAAVSVPAPAAVPVATPPIASAPAVRQATDTPPARSATASTAPGAPATARVRGTDLLPGRHDALPMVARDRRGGFARDTGEPEPMPEGLARGRNESLAYLADQQQRNYPGHVAGGGAYFHSVGQEALGHWRPASMNAPTVGETILGNAIASTAVSMATSRLTFGPAAMPGATSSAHDSLDAAHPNSPMMTRPNFGSHIAEASARRYIVELDVEQSGNGRLRAVRIVRSSGDVAFDLRAQRAVRDTIADNTFRPPSGGVRSRWSFELVRSRDPIAVLAPGLPGEAPVPMIAFEATDDGELHGPLREHTRKAVRILWSRPLRTGPVR